MFLFRTFDFPADTVFSAHLFLPRTVLHLSRAVSALPRLMCKDQALSFGPFEHTTRTELRSDSPHVRSGAPFVIQPVQVATAALSS